MEHKSQTSSSSWSPRRKPCGFNRRRRHLARRPKLRIAHKAYVGSGESSRLNLFKNSSVKKHTCCPHQHSVWEPILSLRRQHFLSRSTVTTCKPPLQGFGTGNLFSHPALVFALFPVVAFPFPSLSLSACTATEKLFTS